MRDLKPVEVFKVLSGITWVSMVSEGPKTGYVFRFKSYSLTEKNLHSFGIPEIWIHDPNDHEADFGGVSKIRGLPST